MGQRSKGDRAAHTTRLPRDVSAAVRARAAARGVTVSGYIAGVVALAMTQPEDDAVMDFLDGVTDPTRAPELPGVREEMRVTT